MRFFKTIGSLSCVAALLCSYGFATEKTRESTFTVKPRYSDGGATVTDTYYHTGTKFQNDSGASFGSSSWSDASGYGDEQLNLSGPGGGQLQVESIYGNGYSPTWTETVEGVPVYTNPNTENSFGGFNQQPTSYSESPYKDSRIPSYDSSTNTKTVQGSFGTATYDGDTGFVDITGNRGVTYDLYNPSWSNRDLSNPDMTFGNVYEVGLLNDSSTTGNLYNPNTGNSGTSTTTRSVDPNSTSSSYGIDTTQTWDY